ncbi:hypothetical protein BHE74_00020336 [Ensete ventricosum]|nr:hypothetical protein BHE74_00020336 [Ensete ventricosum]
MADYDLTSRIAPHLDRHLVFPLLEFLQERELYADDEILKAKIQLLSQTNMVDYAMDIHKALYHTEDVPQDMVGRRVEVVARLKSLEESAAPLISFLQNASLVQELRPDKQYNIQMLHDRFQIEALYQYAKFQLPADFFDGQGAKRQKTDTVPGGSTQSTITPAGSSFSYKQGKKDLSPVSQPLNAPESLNIRSEKVVVSEETSVSKPSTKLDRPSKMMGGTDAQQDMGVLPNNFFDNNERTDDQPLKQIEDKSNLQLKKVNKTLDSSNQTSQASEKIDGSDAKQVKGALPEGFFDNKDADLRARGIEPVKVDIK